MIVASATVEEVLLILKVLFLLLLYLFIWRIVRTASRDLRLPQESFILAPSGGGAVTPARTAATGALVVVKSPALRVGQRRDLDSAPITVGRGSQNDIGLGDDQYASARHARFEPRQDGVWLQDLGSSNGTFVNGTKLTHARKLAPGDVIRIGETDFRFDPQ